MSTLIVFLCLTPIATHNFDTSNDEKHKCSNLIMITNRSNTAELETIHHIKIKKIKTKKKQSNDIENITHS